MHSYLPFSSYPFLLNKNRPRLVIHTGLVCLVGHQRGTCSLGLLSLKSQLSIGSNNPAPQLLIIGIMVFHLNSHKSG